MDKRKPSAFDQAKGFAGDVSKLLGNTLTLVNNNKPAALTNVLKGREWNANLPRFGGTVSPLPEQAKVSWSTPAPQVLGQKTRVPTAVQPTAKPTSAPTLIPLKPSPTPTAIPLQKAKDAVKKIREANAGKGVSDKQIMDLYAKHGDKLLSQLPTPTPTPRTTSVPTQTNLAAPTPFPQNPVNGYVKGTPEQYIPIINKAAQQTGMPTSLLSALLAHESMRWNPDVISGAMNSPVGAQGIGQFMPATAKGLGINPLDPNEAIPAAAKYFMSHYNKYGRPDWALAGYNAGGGAVNQYGGIPPYKETQNYVKYILADADNIFNSQ